MADGLIILPFQNHFPEQSPGYECLTRFDIGYSVFMVQNSVFSVSSSDQLPSCQTQLVV